VFLSQREIFFGIDPDDLIHLLLQRLRAIRPGLPANRWNPQLAAQLDAFRREIILLLPLRRIGIDMIAVAR